MVVNERSRYCKILTQPAETSGRGIELGRFFPYQMQLEQVQERRVQSGMQSVLLDRVVFACKYPSDGEREVHLLPILQKWKSDQVEVGPTASPIV